MFERVCHVLHIYIFPANGHTFNFPSTSIRYSQICSCKKYQWLNFHIDQSTMVRRKHRWDTRISCDVRVSFPSDLGSWGFSKSPCTQWGLIESIASLACWIPDIPRDFHGISRAGWFFSMIPLVFREEDPKILVDPCGRIRPCFPKMVCRILSIYLFERTAMEFIPPLAHELTRSHHIHHEASFRTYVKLAFLILILDPFFDHIWNLSFRAVPGWIFSNGVSRIWLRPCFFLSTGWCIAQTDAWWMWRSRRAPKHSLIAVGESKAEFIGQIAYI